jgi:hypothetical protein
MKGQPDTNNVVFFATNTTASGSNAVITLGANTDGNRHVIDWVAWSYAAAPTSGQITISGIAISGETSGTFIIDITAAGPGGYTFPGSGLRGIANTAVVVTLVDGTAAKKLNIGYR